MTVAPGGQTAKKAVTRARKEKAQPQNPAYLPCTDLGNSGRMYRACGSTVRFDRHVGKWRVYDPDSGLWRLSEDGQIERLARQVVEGIAAEARNPELAPEDRAALQSHAFRSQSLTKMKSMIELLKSELEISVASDIFDVDPWVVTCRNGTLDLKSGKLKTHRKEDYITRGLPVVYDPKASCPTWEKFIDRIMDGRAGLVEYIQRALGYSLTGQTSEQVLFLMHGTGANGKSTFIELVSWLFGGHAQQAEMSSFLSRQSEGPRNDLARLAGARFVSAVEIGGLGRLDEALVKGLTGGDQMTARFLYQEYFQFRPAFKIWLAANRKPNIKGSDYGIWRRVRLIPFDVRIAETERDRGLLDKLKAEGAGILAWIVRGCRMWQESGLAEPPEVTAETENYRAEMDVLGDYLAVRCMEKPGARVRASVLYTDYKTWAETQGDSVMPQRTFGLKLGDRGIRKVRTKAGFEYLGLGLVPTDAQPEQLALGTSGSAGAGVGR